MLVLDDIETDQTLLTSPVVYCPKKEYLNALRCISGVKCTENWRFLPDTLHILMYLLLH